MNLEELQVKVSLDLKEFNKQLKGISKSINDTLGPQATKRMMVNTHKVIKNESKDINKTLNSAFEIDTRKFNASINRAMSQAKLTVRDACNEIRRELNSAFNVQGSIKITGKASVSAGQSSASSSNTAIISSSQYTGAMIIKAVNAIIDTNNKNTRRLEQELGSSTDKIVSAIKKIKVAVTVKQTHSKSLQRPKNDTEIPLSTVKDPSMDIAQAIAEAMKSFKKEAVKLLGTGSDVYSKNGLATRPVNFTMPGEIIDPRTIPTKAFKQIQDIIEAINYEIKGTEIILANVENRALSIVKAFNGLSKVNSTLTGEVVNPGMVPVKEFEQLQNIIDGVNFKVIDDELEQQIQKAIGNVNKDIPAIEISDFTMDVNKAVSENIARIELELRKLEEIKPYIFSKGPEKDLKASDILGVLEKIKLSLKDLDEIDIDLDFFDFGDDLTFVETLDGLKVRAKNAREELEDLAQIFKHLNEVSSQPVQAKSIEDLIGIQPPKSTQPTEVSTIDELIGNESKKPKKPTEEAIKKLKDAIKEAQKIIVLKLDTGEAQKEIDKIKKQISEASKITPDFDSANPMASFNEQQLDALLNSDSMKNLTKQFTTDEIFEAYSKRIGELSNRLEEAKNDLMSVLNILDMFEGVDVGGDAVENLLKLDDCKKILTQLSKTDLSHLNRDINKLAESVSDSNFDTSDIDKLKNQLQALKEVRDKLSTITKTANNTGVVDRRSLDIQFKALRDYRNVSFGEGGSDSLGISAYQQQLNKLKELAQKISKSVRKALSDALNPDIGPAKLDNALTTIENKIVSITKAIKDGVITTIKFAIDEINEAIDITREALIKLGQVVANVAKTIKASITILIKHFNLVKEVISNVVNTIAVAIGSKLGRTAAILVIKFYEIGKAIVDVAKKTKNWLMIAFAHVLDVIEDKVNKVVEAVKKLVSTITNIATKIKASLVNAFNTAIEFIIDKFDALVEAVKTVATKVKNWFMITFAYVADAVENAFNKVVSVIKEVGKAIVDIAGKVKTVLANAFNTAIDYIANKFSKLVDTIKTIATKTKNWFSIAFAYVADVVEDTISKIVNVIKNIEKAIVNIAGKIKTSLVNAFGNVIDYITNKFSKVAEVVKTISTKVRNWFMIAFAHIADVVEDTIGKIVNIIRSIEKAIVNIASKIKTALANAFNSVIDYIADKFNKVVDVVKGVVDATITAFNKVKNWFMITFAYIADVIEGAFNKVKDNVVKVFKNVSTLAKAYGSVIRKHIEKIFEPIVNIGKKIATSIKNGINGAINSVKTVATNIKDTIKNAFDSAVNSVKNSFNKITTSIKNGVNGAINSVKTVATNIKDTTKKAFDITITSAKNSFNKIASFSSSVAKGISKVTSTSINGVKKLSKEIKDNVFGSFKQKKEGFVDLSKVKEGLDKVKDSSKKVAQDIKKSFKDAFDFVGSKFNRNKDSEAPKQVKTKMYTSYTPEEDTTDYSGLTKRQQKFHKMLRDSDKAIEKMEALFANALGVMFPKIDFNWLHDANSAFFEIYESLRKIAIKWNVSLNNFASKAKKAFKELLPVTSEIFSKIKTKISNTFANIKTGKFYNNILQAFNKAKIAASQFATKTRLAINNAFTSIKTGKLYANISQGLNRARSAVSSFSSKARTSLNNAFTSIKTGKLYANVSQGLNRAKSAVSNFSSKVKPILNKAFTGIKIGAQFVGNIKASLSKVKAALNKFATNCKSIWSKITGIFRKGSSGCASAISPLKSKLTGLISTFGGMFGLYGLGRVFIDSTKQAMQYEASLMTMQRTLGGASKSLIDFANNSAQAFGISKSQVMQFGNIYSVIVSNFESDATKAANTTKKLLQSAGIIAGATGYQVNDVLENLRSGILGSSEAVDQLGLNLKVRSLEASESFRQIANGAKSWNDLTEAQKQAIIAQEIINQTTAKYGGIVKNTSSMHNAFMAQLSNTKLALGQLGKALYTAILPALTKIMAVLEKVFTYAAQAVTKFLSLFGITVDFASSMSSAEGTFGDSLGDSVSDSFDDTAESVDKATDSVEKFKGSLMGFDEINVLTDNTNKNEDTSTDTPGSGDMPGVGDLGDLEAPELSETENVFDKLGNKLQAFLSEVLEPFKAAWDNLGGRWTSAWSELLKSFENFSSSLATFLKSVWDNGGEEFVQHMAEIGLAVGIAAMEIGGTILDSLAKLWDHLDPAKNMNTQEFLDVLNSATESVRDLILNLGGYFESFMANGGQELLNALGGLVVDIGTLFATLVKESAECLDSFFAHMDPAKNQNSKDALSSLTTFVESISGLLDAIGDGISHFMDSGGQEFVNNMGDVVAIIIDLAAAMGSGIIDIITGFMNSWVGQEMIAACAKALEWFSEKLAALKEVIEPLKAVFRDIVDFIVGIFEGDGEKVGRAFVSFIKNAIKVGIELTEFMQEIGKELMLGLIEGIKALPELIWGAIKFIFDFIVGAFKELFGIHSPSTVFRDLGINLMEGLIEGIESLITAIGDVFTNIKEAVVGWVQDIVGEAVETWGGITTSITTNVGELYNDVSKKWEDIYDDVTGYCKGVYDDAIDKWDKVKKNVTGNCKAIYDDAIDKWDKVKKNVTTNCKAIYDDAIDKWDKVKKNVTTNCKAIYDDAIAKWDKVKENVTENCKTIYDDAIDKWDKVKDNVTENCKTICSDAIAKWDKVKENVTTNCKAIYDDAIDKWDKVKKNVTTNCKAIYDDAIDKWDKVKTNVTTNCKDICSDAIAKWDEIKDNVTTNCKTIYDDAIDKWNKVKTNVTGNCGEIYNDAIAKWNEIKDNVTTNCSNIYTNAEANWRETKNATLGYVGNIKSEVESAYDGLKTHLGNVLDNIKTEAPAKWEAIKSTTNEWVGNVVSEATSKFGEIKQGFFDKIDDVKNTWGPKWESIKSTANTWAENIASEAAGKFGEIKNRFTKKLDEAKIAMEPKWETLKSSASTGASKMLSGITQGLSKVTKTITGPFEEAKKAVENVVKNIGNAFKNVTWSLPKIKLPHFSISGGFSLNPPKVPTFKVEWYKRGGIIDGITPLGFTGGTIHMGGEAGKEMVVPLENTSFTTKIAKAMGQAVDNAMARREKAYRKYNDAVDNSVVVLKVNKGEFNIAGLASVSVLETSIANMWNNIKANSVESISDIVNSAGDMISAIGKGLNFDSLQKYVNNMADNMLNITQRMVVIMEEMYVRTLDKLKMLKYEFKNLELTIPTPKIELPHFMEEVYVRTRDKLKMLKYEFKNLELIIPTPKIELPHFKISGGFSFNPPSVPEFSIEWYKRGGIINGITPLGMTGSTMHVGGEAGSEMVVPLENTSFTSKIAQAMGQAVDNAMARNMNNYGSAYNTVNDNRDIVLQINDREFARASINSINKLQRESGKTLLDI